ncbi:MAG: phosphoenolpyruvate carboxylase, partial [Fluviibacter sp.]
LPGWFGFGSAVALFLADGGSRERKSRLALLRRMYQEWPFFQTLLSNIDMVLAKSDLALGSRYAELLENKRLRKKIFGAIEAEWHLTVDSLNQITGDKQRLTMNPGLARSIRHRFPYIDPLHHLQLELIRRYRSGNAGEKVQRGIHLSINGIASALRNTG